MQASRRDQQMIERIVREAARMMHEDNIHDAATARRRAMSRLGIRARRDLPDLHLIELALIEHRQLFASDQDVVPLHRLRASAVAAMRFFDRFRPRLVGLVLKGGAGERTPVQLHLHADHPDDVTLFLLDHGISARQQERRMRLGRKQESRVPGHDFNADGVDFELTVLPLACLRQSPLNEDGQPIRRASMSEVERLQPTR